MYVIMFNFCLCVVPSYYLGCTLEVDVQTRQRIINKEQSNKLQSTDII